MKATETKKLAKKVLFVALDNLECEAKDSWVLSDLSDEEKDKVEQVVFRLIETLKKKYT
jgi:hypothetical protein